jgi:branched-chain amino acid transport system permease protein
MNIILISIMVAVGLNLVTGYTGQVNLGMSGFVAIGAYATTILMTKLGISFWLACPLGAVIAALSGLIIALPSLRLSGVYLALVTFGFAAIVQMVLIHGGSLTNGSDGMSVPSPYLGSFKLTTDTSLFYLILIVTSAMVFFAYKIIKSNVGRAFISIRDNEIAAKAMGVNITAYKIVSFSISGFYGGLAGALFAVLIKFISPDAFDVLQSIIYMTMVTIGGMGSILGSIIGGVTLSLLPEMLRGFMELQELIFGGALIVSLIFLPDGIVGLTKKWGNK